MNFEDLKVGMVIVSKEGKEFRKITSIGERKYLHKGNGTDSEWIGSDVGLNDFSEFKDKKRYWRWDLDCSSGIFKSGMYIDENGLNTLGNKQFDKNNLIKKHENDFIEI